METTKQSLLNCLRGFVAQRAGLEFGNYGDVKLYRQDQRSITKDRHHAEALINAVAWRDGITVDDIIKASEGAFSGRLTIERVGNGFKIDYCVGQYFPTEYRRAVCAVLSSTLWDYWRDNSLNATPGHGAESIRYTAKRELGRSIGSRWFN